MRSISIADPIAAVSANSRLSLHLRAINSPASPPMPQIRVLKLNNDMCCCFLLIQALMIPGKVEDRYRVLFFLQYALLNIL